MKILKKLSISLIFILIFIFGVEPITVNASTNNAEEDFCVIGEVVPIDDGTKVNNLVGASYTLSNADVDLEYYNMKDEIMILTENQNRYGLCWAFATCKVLETTIAKSTGEYYNFVDWWTTIVYRLHNKNVIGAGGTFGNVLDGHKPGVMLECDFPIEEFFAVDNINSQTYYDLYKENAFLLDNYAVFYSSTFSKYDTLDEIGKKNIRNQIKNYLLDNGAMWLYCKYFAPKPDEFGNSIMLPIEGASGGAHAVTLLGWDDNIDCGEAGRGAWICLNSYGEKYNSNNGSLSREGIFYIPYSNRITYNDRSLSGYVRIKEGDDKFVEEIIFNSEESNGNYVIFDTIDSEKYPEGKPILQKNVFKYGSMGELLVYNIPNGYDIGDNVKVYYNDKILTDKFDITIEDDRLKILHSTSDLLAAGTYKIVITGLNQNNESVSWTRSFTIMADVGICDGLYPNDFYPNIYNTQISNKAIADFVIDINKSTTVTFNLSTYTRIAKDESDKYDIEISNLSNNGVEATCTTTNLNPSKKGGYVDGTLIINFNGFSTDHDLTKFELRIKGADGYLYNYIINLEHTKGGLGQSSRIPRLYVNLLDKEYFDLSEYNQRVYIDYNDNSQQVVKIPQLSEEYIFDYKIIKWDIYYYDSTEEISAETSYINIAKYIGIGDNDYVLENYANNPKNTTFSKFYSIILVPTIELNTRQVGNKVYYDIIDRCDFETSVEPQNLDNISGDVQFINNSTITFTYGTKYKERDTLGIDLKINMLDIDAAAEKWLMGKKNIVVLYSYNWNNFRSAANYITVNSTGVYTGNVKVEVYLDENNNNLKDINENELLDYREYELVQTVYVKPKEIYIDVTDYNLVREYVSGSVLVPEANNGLKSLNELLNSEYETGVETQSGLMDKIRITSVEYENSLPGDIVNINFGIEGDNAENYKIVAVDSNKTPVAGQISKLQFDVENNFNEIGFVKDENVYTSQYSINKDNLLEGLKFNVKDSDQDLEYTISKKQSDGTYGSFTGSVNEVGEYQIEIKTDVYDEEIYDLSNSIVYVSITSLKDVVEWSVPEDLTVEDGKYVVEYDKNKDYSNAFAAQGKDTSIMAELTIVKVNGEVFESVESIKDAGEYLITANSTNSNIEFDNKTLTLVIKQKILENNWEVPEGFVLDGLVATGEYTGDALKQLFVTKITDTEYSDLDIIYESSGDVKNVGEYSIKASIDGGNIILRNEKLTVIVQHKIIKNAIKWTFGSRAYQINDVDGAYEFVYFANELNIKANYEFIENLSISKLENQEYVNVTQVKEIGAYKVIANINSNYKFADELGEDADTIIVRILPRPLSIVLNDISAHRYEEVQNITRWESLSEDQPQAKYTYLVDGGDELKDSELNFTILYYLDKDCTIPTTIDDINKIRNEWYYTDDKPENLVKTFYVKIEEKNIDTYEIDYKYDNEKSYAEIKIELKQYKVIFRKDEMLGANNQKERLFYQSQKIELQPDELFNKTENRNFSTWYIENSNGSFEPINLGNIQLVSSLTLHTYSIYKVYYYDKDNATIIGSSEFHKRNSIKYPSDVISKPQKEYYENLGWNTSATAKDKILLTDTPNKNLQDIKLYPVFKAIEYCIPMYQSIPNEAGSDGRREYEESTIDLQLVIFTIEDYLANKTFNLGDKYPKYEGFIFKGWYFKSTTIKNPSEKTEFVVEDGLFEIKTLIPKEEQLVKFLEQGEHYGKVYGDESHGKEVRIVAKYEVLECQIMVVVGDTIIYEMTTGIGEKINKDYFLNLVDRKFGYMYILEEVPDYANATALTIKIKEVPFLYITLGVIVVLGGVVVLTIVTIRKKRNNKDQKKLNYLLNNLDE